MRGKIKLASFVLCALVMFGFAITAQAQATFSVSSNPNEVTHYGVTEVMGRVRLELTGGTTQGSTITITYQGVNITNNGTVGITVNATGVLAGNVVLSQVVPTSGTGGQVILSITAGATFSGTANADTITVDGVRADVSAKALSTDILASLSSAPSTANTFSNVSQVRVATVNESLVVIVSGVIDAICLTPSNPTLTIKEGSAGAFVQYVTAASGAVPSASNLAGARAKYGANNNVRINIVLSPLPTGTTLTWTSPVAGSVAASGRLELISQSSSGDSALYEFVTANQAISDANVESFVIVPTVSINKATAVPGSSTAQAQLYPPNPAGATAIPRFNHPLINVPADVLLTINKCTTNLLFPFLTNAAGVGFDSGMALVNTSQDPYGTVAQEGTATLYFYGTAAPAAPVTTPSIPAGSHYAASLSTIAPGFQGYVIAICQFQYGHGFAFITGKYNSGSVYDVAEGYLALVIPDTAFNNGVRGADPIGHVGNGSGENLGN